MEYQWWIFALCVPVLSFLVFVCLLRIITSLKQVRAQYRRGRTGEGNLNQRNLSEHSSADGLSDLDELVNLEEQMEIEQFLAEIRSSEVQPNTSLSVDARKEFIANVLISQRVRMVNDESKDDSDENDKDSELFICRLTCDRNPKEFDKATTGPQCSICLLEYSDGDDICWSHNKRCNHHFHRGCMIEWLKSNNECPLCRNNYLALSDDEETEIGGNPSLPSSPDDTSVFSQVSNAAGSIQHNYTTLEGEINPIQVGQVAFQVADLEVCIAQENVSEVSSSSDESIYTENDSWSQSGESDQEGSGVPTATSDAWSCPSANNLENVPEFDNFAIDHRPRNHVQSRATDEETAIRGSNQEVSLELDDLIVDGLMRRLEKRASNRDVPLGIDLESDSCTSVYTRNSKE